ncbi:DUF896 domain-containing protein [Fundicoccus culcitae]|uniref:UPF0291 protein NRE15_02825 n=1 Tax=Fundicoccus culcitae TaxID=2969821 RepID=A0ABY5PA57_9LACT|nr:DUF896 domain-containing protein [Fundicoccus culcitae]UUX35444.1 DUF896 domain-containing protein [Fundicoccus culcitae]
MDQKLIARINALAKKKKTLGLTIEEEVEQKALREKYLSSFRSGLKNHVEGIKIIDREGNDLTSDKVKHIQKAKKLHNRHLED